MEVFLTLSQLISQKDKTNKNKSGLFHNVMLHSLLLFQYIRIIKNNNLIFAPLYFIHAKKVVYPRIHLPIRTTTISQFQVSIPLPPSHWFFFTAPLSTIKQLSHLDHKAGPSFLTRPRERNLYLAGC